MHRFYNPQQERFMVVAFTGHHNVQTRLDEWPQHLGILPWSQGYRSQAANRIADAIAGFGPLRLDVLGKVTDDDAVTAWNVGPCDAVGALRRKVSEAALKYDTQLMPSAEEDDLTQSHIVTRDSQPCLEVGNHLILSEVSVVYCHEALGRTVFRNLALDTVSADA